jgi:hypothetical protein
MKSVVLSSSPRLILFLALPLALSAQAELATPGNDPLTGGLPSTSAADVVWQSLPVTKKTAEQSDNSASRDPAAISQSCLIAFRVMKHGDDLTFTLYIDSHS